MPNVGSVTDNESAAWHVHAPGGSMANKESGYWTAQGGGSVGTISNKEYLALAATPGTIADKEIVHWRTVSGLPVGLTVADYEYAASKLLP